MTSVGRQKLLSKPVAPGFLKLDYNKSVLFSAFAHRSLVLIKLIIEAAL